VAKVQPNRPWGTLLAKLRKAAQLTGAEVVHRLAILGVRLDRRTLYTYEAGRVMAPDAAVVWGLAQIYRADLDGLLEALVASRNSQTVPAAIDRPGPKAPRISSEELRLLNLLRKLPPRSRGECEQFIRFHADRVAKSALHASRKSRD
jgi:transcriptional regulator with XRE-family HTH domain